MSIINGSVKWGIIGCGDVCEVKSGPAFNKVPDSKLVAVMRRDEAKAKDYALRHGVPKYYTNANDLVNDEEVNAIYIATPPSTHEEYTEMALKAGKPVYVEKPVSLSSAATERMIEMEMNCKGKVSVAHYRRSLPLFIKIKQLINEGAIGKVRLVLLKTLQPSVNNKPSAENWRIVPGISGGGIFHDISPHQLDILYWLFGSPLETNLIPANQGKHYDAADSILLQMKFDDEIYFSGVWNFNISDSAAEESCEIIGDKGKIRFSFFKISKIELSTGEGNQVFEEEYPINIQEPHIHNVVKFFRGESDNPCTLKEALVTMNILDKAVI